MTTIVPPVRVLVVDDQDVIRAAAAALLEDENGITIVGEASNGADAIDLVSSTDPNVVLMDMRMPVMDGVEATRVIAELHPTCAVLVHSAYGDESLVLEAFQAGAHGYVLKGSAASDLVTAVQNVASGKAHVSDEVARPLISKLVDALGRERQTRIAAEEAADLIERVSARQQEFAIQAAHELRTPLTALLGSLEVLADADDLGVEDRASLVDSAIDAVRRFGRLTDDLEVIATGDLLELKIDEVSVRHAVEDVIEDLGASGSAVQHDVGSIAVLADAERFRQILHNVLRNALTASRSGSLVQIRAAVDADLVHIDAVDAGHGFDVETLDGLFEPFVHKLGSACGLGAGMAVVHDLIVRMGGSVTATNNEAGGATIRLTFKGASR